MKVTATALTDVLLLDLDRRGDSRGFFARFFCADEMRDKGLCTDYPQINTSVSVEAGTLRGMHYQLPPHGEVKIVRCLTGSLFDVVIDLRHDSPSFMQSFGYTLSADNKTMMYVPVGCAHGFITLEPNTEVLYMVSSRYAPDSERGLRFNDPAFRIDWATAPTCVSEKDLAWPDFDLDWHGCRTMTVNP